MNRFPVTKTFQMLTFLRRNGILMSFSLQMLLIARIALNPICVHQRDSKRQFLLLIERFLAGFARKNVPSWLNKQATLCINRLNFRRAVKCMELSIQLENYKMAVVCADLIRQGRVGVSIDLEKALEIAKAGKRKSNSSCLIHLIFYDIHNRESKRLRDQRKLYCPEDVERLRTYMPNITHSTCDCKYCDTLRGTQYPRKHSLACFRAARDGYAPAQYAFGRFIADFKTLPHRRLETLPCAHEEALSWFIRAALQGHPLALERVALHLFWGWGTEINLNSAYLLFQRAKEAGNMDCDEYLTSIKKMMEK